MLLGGAGLRFMAPGKCPAPTPWEVHMNASHADTQTALALYGDDSQDLVTTLEPAIF